jgi:hypothetical protein
MSTKASKGINFKYLVDISPWDSSGHSAFGLTRKTTKWIGTGLILFAICLMIPDPFTGILNVIITKLLSPHYFAEKTGELLSYTIIPWVIFFLGIWIYPHNTESLFNGYINKLQKSINKTLRDPKALLITIISLYITYKLYQGWF